MKVAADEVETRVAAAAAAPAGEGAVYSILLALSFCHFLNDTIASLVPSIYPLFKNTFSLDYAQVGFITLAYQCTASIFQPLVGIYHRPPAQALFARGRHGLHLRGAAVPRLCRELRADHRRRLLRRAGLGHVPSRGVAGRAHGSGGQHGLAQSLFQVGGNLGSSIGPLAAAFIVIPRGQGSIIWFTLAALLAMAVLTRVGTWYKQRRVTQSLASRMRPMVGLVRLSSRKIGLSLAVLLALMFSKFFYTAGLTNFYIFYLMDRFHMPVETAQIYLFVFLASVAVGTLIGGPIGDRIGRNT